MMQDITKAGAAILWNGNTYVCTGTEITGEETCLVTLSGNVYCFVGNLTKINGVLCQTAQDIKTLITA